jgi:hypothetical protein
MDIDNNLELKYLTNTHYRNSRKQEILTLNKEFEKYKDRILDLTSLLTKQHQINQTLNKAFIEYSNVCISYLKDVDLNDLIQEDYTDYKEKRKLTKVEPLDQDINKTIFNQEKDKNLLEKFVQIKKKEEDIFIPLKKK